MMHSSPQKIEQAERLMRDFADRTGLASARPPVRYLWTDAFAVCNLLELARVTSDSRHTELALRLVDQVHHVLGRYRSDDSRTGWLSGLEGDEGEAHPTRGGLRIGKLLPERRSGEAFDAELEWERDGQYFHYLTKWMFALDQVSRATREPHFNLWARELAEVAHRSFCTGHTRMVWKMSTDLSRPLVPSMGQHDPLDGLITFAQLDATALASSSTPPGPGLSAAIDEFATMIQRIDFATEDPLGLGALLMGAAHVDQLMTRGRFAGGALRASLLRAALEGLFAYARRPDLRQPATSRLAFREIGLAIGLSALPLIRDGAFVAALSHYSVLASQILSFWLEPEHQLAPTWSAHRDINEVMLASGLVPGACLVLTGLD
jgi:hypothetical protein